MKKIEEYLNKIREWGNRTRLRINGTTQAQGLKLLSEFGEIAEGIKKNNIEEIKDGIGDVIVVAIMLEGILQNKEGYKQTIVIPENLNTQEQSTNESVDEIMLNVNIVLGKLSDAILKKQKNIIELINSLIIELNKLATKYNMTLEECLEQSYNEIKDRNGILTPDGVFVKSTDPEYERIKKLYS